MSSGFVYARRMEICDVVRRCGGGVCKEVWGALILLDSQRPIIHIMFTHKNLTPSNYLWPALLPLPFLGVHRATRNLGRPVGTAAVPTGLD